MNLPFGQKDKAALFLPTSSLMARVFALLVLGGGPFACREWQSLSYLVLLTSFVGASRSARGVFRTSLGILIAVLFVFVGTSTVLAQHPGLENALIAFSAYGVGLYAIGVLVPSIPIEEMLVSCRRSWPPLRQPLVVIVHVGVMFFSGHAGVLKGTAHTLRTSGCRFLWRRPWSVFPYADKLFCSLWLYVLSQVRSIVIAMKARLIPALSQFQRPTIRLSVCTVVVMWIAAIGAYIIATDFVTNLFT